MQKKEYISMAVIRRLPRYYRFLRVLDRKGIARISSKEMADKMGFTASQVRQDFNCFGGYGQQGYGYSVHQLFEEIGSILGLNRVHKCILIGAGNLGKAIATHMSYNFAGFDLLAIFDNSKRIIGESVAGKNVMHYDQLAEYCTKEKPVMAILCVPSAVVETVVDDLYALGIKSFWNFSHFDIGMKYPDVVAENVHLNDSMMTLCYRISR